MNFVFLALVFVALIATVASVATPADKDFACNDYNNNCLSCIQFTKNLAFQCTYCPVDGKLKFPLLCELVPIEYILI